MPTCEPTFECRDADQNSLGYSLARSIYEESPEKPLPSKVLEDTIVEAAMNAYDNASNPNRTRGGLLKADDM